MPGPAALISVASGAPQQAPLGAAFASLVALVTDVNGNPVSGVTVTFVQDGGQSAFCTFAGGANTATTNGSGLATSATITASGAAGQFPVRAWIGTPGPGAIGPANFWLTNSAALPGLPPAILAAWTTYKTHEASLITDLQTVINTDLVNIENDRNALAALGMTSLVELIQKRIECLCADNIPLVSAWGGPVINIPKVMAPAGAPVTLSVSGHISAPQPVSSIVPFLS
jgi:hypothetical protein